MKIVTTRAEMRAARGGFARIGFVPTMGFLHDGHLSLVRAAKEACGAVAVSIFVNPTQFGPGEDLASYPRDLERDLALLEEAGADLVWTPGVEDVYPDGAATRVRVTGVSDVLEGAKRPGHFDGVATVVSILLNVVAPDQAFFGRKDVQQTVVIARMVADLGMPVEIVVSPTRREADGLAMSSRNVYLDSEQRAAAPVLYRALQAAEAAWREGETNADALRGVVTATLATEPLAREVDYVSVADPSSLAELDRVDPATGAVASLAVRIGRARLIDNVALEPRAQPPARAPERASS